MYSNEELKSISTQVRRDIVRMVTLAGCGHPGGSMSSADILTALYFNEMKNDPATWTRDGKGQDVFILSAGHMTPVYYSVLARRGYFPVVLSDRAFLPLPASLLRRSWMETVSGYMLFVETARARKARSGKQACLRFSISLTTLSP